MTPHQVTLADTLLRRLTHLETARTYAHAGKAVLVCSRSRESYTDKQEIEVAREEALAILKAQTEAAKAKLRELGVEIE